MIYYLEDDDNIRELVVYTLKQVNLPSEGFAGVQAFRTAMQQRLPDLILLDVMLPGEDGISILRQLRAERRTEAIPVILITARGAEFDKVQGLDAGADDYITKPFGMAELLARVRARLRRVETKQDGGMLVFDGLRLDKPAHEVSIDGNAVQLTLKEYELLRFLMENRNVAFSREQLLEHIWDCAYEGGSRTVDVHIQTLRAKLGAHGYRIETVRGIGYRFGGRKT